MSSNQEKTSQLQPSPWEGKEVGWIHNQCPNFSKGNPEEWLQSGLSQNTNETLYNLDN